MTSVVLGFVVFYNVALGYFVHKVVAKRITEMSALTDSLVAATDELAAVVASLVAKPAVDTPATEAAIKTVTTKLSDIKAKVSSLLAFQ